MLQAVADTHVVIWYIYNDPRLSSTAKAFIERAAQQGNTIGLSAVSIAEIVYLAEKGRIPSDALTHVQRELDLPGSVLTVVSFDRPIAETLPQVDRSKVPDFPDRIIAATALHLNIPLISKDAKIQVSGVPTIW
jgi:PIN domain nuclease of toxin-antitoxin system